MKKFISVALCAVMLVFSMSAFAGAVSIDAGRSRLNASMRDGEASNGVDYVYFSPVKGESDTTKYPLMIWLHGMKSGLYPRDQLRWYGFSNWASDEYQERFKNAGGCFLFAPRAQNSLNNWDSTQTAVLKSAIDEFIASCGDNIDTSRIYIAGYSTGAVMVWDMLLAYPDFFAAALPAAAITQPAGTLSSLADVSVWILSCDKDYYVSGRSSAAKMVFNQLKGITNRPDGLRHTAFSQAVFANGNKKGTANEEHYVWEAITYDMHMADRVTPYEYASTVDGTGKSVSFENPDIGVIDWLSQQRRPEKSDTGNKFFARIIEFYRSIFRMIASFISNIF